MAFSALKPENAMRSNKCYASRAHDIYLYPMVTAMIIKKRQAYLAQHGPTELFESALG